jgi:hypothetical protein
MRLSDLPGLLLQDIIGTWRRRIIAGGVIAVCAIGVIIEGFSAARHALEQSVGPVGARLILAGTFALVIVATYVWLRLAEGRKSQTAAEVKTEERTVMIAEALSLGYTLAQEFSKKSSPRPPDEAHDGPPRSDDAASNERPAA